MFEITKIKFRTHQKEKEISEDTVIPQDILHFSSTQSAFSWNLQNRTQLESRVFSKSVFLLGVQLQGLQSLRLKLLRR